MKTDVVDYLDLSSGRATQTWYLTTDIPEDKENIKQSSAYCYKDGKFAIVRKKGSKNWAIPGGHLEEGENPSETVIREAYEEAYIKIENPTMLGYQRIDKADGTHIYQLRWVAPIQAVLEFKGEYEIEEVKFISSEEFPNLISWWSSSNGGKAEMEAALKNVSSNSPS